MEIEFTEEQKRILSKWAADGLNLSQIQKNILDEFHVSLTYMDVRLIAIELGLEIRDKASSRAPVPDADDDLADDSHPDAVPQPQAGGVDVAVDRIMRPDSLVSGTVTFSDGVAAKWFLDRTGRLGIDAGRPGYQPAQEDIHAFQLKLRELLEKRGF